ncbi:MAG: membrane dipeptidase [Oceanicaulis sp.]
MEEARELIAGTLVWDNHACMPLRPEDPAFLQRLETVAAAGVDVVSLNIGFGSQDLDSHVRNLAAFRVWIGARPDQYVLARTLSDIDAARRAGKLAVIFDIEGLAPFDAGDHGLVEMFATLGVKWALVAYNRNNASGGGCMDEDGGLTDHGRALIAEMGRAGMAVCCSHTGHRTAMEVIEAADGPVIFSHSNASAVFDHPRNIPDDLIKACAVTGGVVGVNGIGAFLGEGLCGSDLAEAMARHADHMLNLVGADHVGVGIDYVFDQAELMEYLATMRDAFPDEPQWRETPRLASAEVLPEFAARLLERGHTAPTLEKVLGANWRRVAEAVWR